jgi:SAM-dependent methyltransferase
MDRSPPLPKGHTEHALLEYLQGFEPAGSDERVRTELASYLRSDFRRFLHTLALVPDGEGRLLEVGADPYFTTLLLRRFRRYDLSLTNGFGDPVRGNMATLVGREGEVCLPYRRFNLEGDDLPAGQFAVVLCCEVIEHMTLDPLRGLATLNRALEPGGTLVLTTPNAARIGVVLSAVAGIHSSYDQSSAYGPYGRHNREYTPRELRQLLEHAGFDVEVCYTSDVNHAATGMRAASVLQSVVELGVRLTRWVLSALRRMPGPAAGLEFYLFVRARKVRPPSLLKPAWLYRSYPSDEVST